MDISIIVHQLRGFGIAFFLGPLLALSSQNAESAGLENQDIRNPLLYAVAWKQTAAEYRALYYQGFNIARMRVQNAIDNRKEGDLPLAVVSDVDDTLVHAMEYWGRLIEENIDFFDDSIWDQWIPLNKITATPGASKFLEFCRENNVEVFYVTSRDQGENTYQYALENLQSLNFPYLDQQHLSVLRDSSNKQPIQNRIAENYNIVVFLGDNLNDFRRKFYSSSIDARQELMEQDKDKFGSQFILFPNPTDGHWLRAIFGESEPSPTDSNRKILRRAAAGSDDRS